MSEKIIVAGAKGLVGTAVTKRLELLGLDYVGISRSDADLLDFESTRKLINYLKPTCVIDAAAVVGGIKYNSDFPVKFLQENLEIQKNLMRASQEANVEKFVFLGSSCVYPRDCPQPIKEEYLLSGKLEKTNSAYAIAKIAGIEMVNSYRKQFNKKWISLMPTNIYGPNDNFDLNHSHVIPAIIRKFVSATNKNLSSVEIWGTGQARREFLYVEDLAQAILFCMENYDSSEHLNIGYGSDITIYDLAKMVSEIVGFRGEIIFNSSFPDGTPQKLLDSTKIYDMGWKPDITLRKGLELTVEWYMKNYLGEQYAD
jgi:GDP-L-fucose synthase